MSEIDLKLKTIIKIRYSSAKREGDLKMDEMNLNVVDATQSEVVGTQAEVIATEQDNTSTDSALGEVATPQQNEKPVQSAEENAKFAEVRRKAEAEAETRTRDRMISEMYGESHGIHTYAEYQAAIAKQAQEEHDQSIREEYEAKGLPEDVVSELVEWKKSREQSKAEQEAKQQQEKQQAEMQDFIKKYPNVKPDDIPVEVWQVNASGVPLRYAYADYANDQATKAEEIARANAENAKSSTGSVSGDGAANSSDFISYDIYEQNKSNPSWVNKNFNKIMNSRAMW